MTDPMNQYNIIGTITRITGYDEATDTHETETLEGYHVNTIEPVPEWEQYRVYPEKPYNIWAPPAPTCFYRFADEDQYIAEAQALGLL